MRKVRYIAALDEVTVTQDGDCARIEYKEAGIALTNLEIGPEIAQMSDGDIVEVHNESLRNDAKQAADYLNSEMVSFASVDKTSS
jgi:hypothetical protein